MQIPFTVKLMIPLVLALASCSKKDSSKPAPGPIDIVVVPPPSGGIDLTDRNTRLKVAFEGLIQNCEAVGGAFDSRTRNCACPETDVPMSFQALTKIIIENGSKKRVFDHFECKEQLTLKPLPESRFPTFKEMLRSSKKAFINDLAGGRSTGNGRVLNFQLSEDASDQSLNDLASFLDDHTVRVGIPSGNQRAESFQVNLLGSKNFISYTKRTLFFDFEDVATIARPGNRIFAWTPDDLLKLQYKPSVSSISTVTPEGPNSDLLEGLQFYQKFLKGEVVADVLEDVMIIDKGCEVVCDYSASFYFKGRFYWYEKNYARGQHFRHALYMGHEDGRIDAMAQLFNDYSPSVFINEHTSIDEAGGVSVTNEAFDPRQKSVDFSSTDVIGHGDGYYEKLNRLDRLDENAPQTAAIYIEGRTRLEEDWEEGFWLRGPYAANLPTPGTSAMGWLKGDTENLNFVEYFNGVFDVDYGTSSMHVREVLHDIVKDFKRGEAYAIPADLMTAPTQLKALATLSKSRVASISSVYPLGEAECNRFLDFDDGGLLWVIGAGNEAKENPIFRCPQRIHREGLKFVVASGSKSALSDHAEYGVDYADIVADPLSYLGRHGSSYAAPKVTNIVLKIIKKFGSDLSNREIRLAILLGADVNVQSRLRVRTGGAINEGFALKAAEAIKGLSADQRRSLIDSKADRRSLFADVITKSGALNGSDAKNQAQYLQGAKL